MVLVGMVVVRARDGDDDVFWFFYLFYVDNVYGYVLVIVRDEHDVEDIISEVFLRFLWVLI